MGRPNMNPYFGDVGNGYIPGAEALPGPHYPIDVPNKSPGSGYMALQMPQEDDFRSTYPETYRDLGKNSSPTNYHHSDIEDSPRLQKNNVAPRKRMASLTPGSLDERSKPVGPISYEKELPWPTELESAYMPVIPNEALLDDYYLPNERFPFLGLDRSYENDLFSPTEPEQAENPYAPLTYSGSLADGITQAYVPYRPPSVPLSSQGGSERPYSVSSMGNPYAYSFGGFDEGVMTPISDFSYAGEDDHKQRPVLRKPVPGSRSSSLPRMSYQGGYSSPRTPERRAASIAMTSIYSPPATPPPIPSPAPPPLPPKLNPSPVNPPEIIYVSGQDIERIDTPVQTPANNPRPGIPNNQPSPFMPDPPLNKAPVPNVAPAPVQKPKRKRWWKRLFSRSK